jgi:sialidase-1
MVLLACLVCAAAPETSEVFVAARDGFVSIRIPAVVVTRRGTVLAFAEGRAAHADQARNKIVLKRSSDAGRTWSPLAVVAADQPHALNNPCAVVVGETGRVLLMYQRYPGHLREGSRQTAVGYDGPDVVRSLLVWSDDDGLTWSAPRDLTRQVKRPERATTICSGPGIGIQLTRGPHRGRLVFPFNEGPFGRWQNYVVYSDDRGETWRWGEDVPGALVADPKGERSQINEVQVAELADGSLRLNSRPMAGARLRKTAVSRDGGVTWSPVADVPEQPGPACMASLLRWRDKLVFSGPESTKRENGTVYLSSDDGATWPVKRVLTPGFFAYSVLTGLPDGRLGCLYEGEGGTIFFARFGLDWVGGG